MRKRDIGEKKWAKCEKVREVQKVRSGRKSESYEKCEKVRCVKKVREVWEFQEKVICMRNRGTPVQTGQKNDMCEKLWEEWWKKWEVWDLLRCLVKNEKSVKSEMCEKHSYMWQKVREVWEK